MGLYLAEKLKRHIGLLNGKIAHKNELLEEKENELAQKEARIRELEEDIAEKIRAFCPACVNGVADTEVIEGIVNDEHGEPVLVYVGENAIECQYCGELIKAILESADKSNQSDKEK